MNFASTIVTATPKAGGAPIQYTSDTTWNEEDFLGEAQADKERGKQFVGNDGETFQTIHRYSSSGKREVTLLDGEVADALTGWAQQNPTIHFDFVFQFQRIENDASSIRRHVHTDCFIENTPARVMNNETATIKFMMKYGKLSVQDGSGNPVS